MLLTQGQQVGGAGITGWHHRVVVLRTHPRQALLPKKLFFHMHLIPGVTVFFLVGAEIPLLLPNSIPV